MKKGRFLFAVLLAVSVVGGSAGMIVNAEEATSEESSPWIVRDLGDSVRIDGYTRKYNKHIVIPAEIDGKKVSLSNVYQFRDCIYATSFEVEGESEEFKAVDGVLYTADGMTLLSYPRAREAEEFEIPEGTYEIGHYAFSDCKYLKKVIVPDSVHGVEACAFSKCKELTEIQSNAPLNLLGGNVLYGCPNLKSLNISSPILSGYDFRFEDMNLLEKADFSSVVGVTSGDYTFARNPKLKELYLPVGVVGNWIHVNVEDCPALEKLTVFGGNGSNGVIDTKISNCENLKEVVIPRWSSSVSFTNCPNLQTIFNYGEDTVHALAALSDEAKQNVTVYCYPYTSVEKYCKEWPIDYHVFGDATNNKEINIIDVLAVNQYLLGLRQLDDAGVICADVDNNGKVDDADAMKILKSLVGLETLD